MNRRVCKIICVNVINNSITKFLFQNNDTLKIICNDNRIKFYDEICCSISILNLNNEIVFNNQFNLDSLNVIPLKIKEEGVFKLKVNSIINNKNTEFTSYIFIGDIKKYFNNLISKNKTLIKKVNEKYQIVLTAHIERLKIFMAKDKLDKDEGIISVRHITELKRILNEIIKGREPIKNSKGSKLGGYFSNIDKSVQYYQYYVPSGYDYSKSIPVVYHLHGAYEIDRPFLNSLEINWIDLVQKREKLAEQYNFITVFPFGRGNELYAGVGQEDLFKILEDLKSNYNIDTSNILLTSYSHGATSVLKNTIRYPSVFSKIAIVAPFTEYSDKDRINQLNNVYQLYYWANSIVGFEKNLCNTSIFLLHGLDDKHSDISNSRKLVEQLKQNNISIEYKELPNSNHFNYFVDPEPLMYEWFSKQTKKSNPPKIHFSTSQLKFNKCFWIEIDELENTFSKAIINSEIKENNIIDITTEGIISLTILTDKLPLNRKKDITINLNGEEKFAGKIPDDSKIKIFIKKTDFNKNEIRKTFNIEGPFEHIYTKDFIIVIGSKGNKDDMRVNKMIAEEIKQYWYSRFFTNPKIKNDFEITKNDFVNSNLVLIGRVNSNTITKDLIDKLPIKILEDKIKSDDLSFNCNNLGFRIIYPNPHNCNKYIGIISGLTISSLEFSIKRFGINGWYDYFIYDDYTESPIINPVAIGFFNKYWKFDKNILYTR